CSFFFASRRRHTRFKCDWSSDVCSSDLVTTTAGDVGLFKRSGVATTATKVDFTIRWIGEPVKASAIQAIDSQRNIYLLDGPGRRSEERRVGEECGRRWSTEG